jgi:hypothetical protein
MNLLDEVIAHQTTASQVYDSNQLELEFVWLFVCWEMKIYRISNSFCCRHFTKFSLDHFVSGGKDGLLKVFKLTKKQFLKDLNNKTRTSSTSKRSSSMVLKPNEALTISHKFKLNSIKTTRSLTPIGNLFVSDHSNNITTYTIH